jgi:glycolate oxidase
MKSVHEWSAIAEEARKVLGDKNVLTSPKDLEKYAHGTFLHMPGGNDQWRFGTSYKEKYLPNMVVEPASAREVTKVVKIANKNKIPIIPWGGGTNLVGATVAINGGIVLNLRKMNRILRIEQDRLYVMVQPAVNLMKLDLELRKRGLRHGTFPGSAFFSTVGGAISSDAHTLAGFKYGTIAENLLELEVVTPSGEIIRTGPWYGAGYDLKHLFTRAEGTLGIITEITMKVHRNPPRHLNLAFMFKTFAEAIETQYAIWYSELPALSTILAFDEFSSKYPQFSQADADDKRGGWVVITLEGTENVVAEASEAIQNIVSTHGGDPLPQQMVPPIDDWWISIGGQTSKLIKTKANLEKITWKIGPHLWVPPDKIGEVRDRFKESVLRHGMQYVGVSNSPTRLMVQVLYDPKDSTHRHAYEKILQDLTKTAHAAGGTIAGAHGCGLAFKDELEEVYGESLEVMRRIKHALDPNNVMNPQKIFD